MSSLPSWTSYFWITQNGCQQTCWNQTLVKNSTCLQQRDGSWWLPQMFLKCSAALVSFPKVLHASSSLGEGRVGTWPSDIRWGRRRKQYYVTESWFLSLEAAGLWFGILLLSPSFTSSRLHSKVYRPCLEAHGASVTRSTVPVQCSTQRQRGTHTTSVTLSAALVWHTQNTASVTGLGHRTGRGEVVSVRSWHVPAEVQRNTAVGVNKPVLYPVCTQTLDPDSWLKGRRIALPPKWCGHGADV